jgi:hypothetical protein
MADRAMLEASMLFHRDSANYLLALARTGPLDVVVSGRLLAIIGSDMNIVRLLAPQFAISPPDAVDVNILHQLTRELPGVAEISSYESSFVNMRDGDERSSQSIEDQLATEIISDEWSFLTSESWLLSKTRRAFDKMVEAGGAAVHLSGRVFDQVVRRTLRKEPGEPLTPGNRVRAVAKWIAVGGPAILKVVEPISSALVGAASECFLLMDP